MHLDRRQILVRGVQLSALLQFGPLAMARCSSDRAERVLVVVELSGGNDGLNTVVPFRQDDYYRGRPTLGLSPDELIPLDDDHGLHPELARLRKLHAAGALGVVHGVGYPQPNRSHFRSMEIWHTADPTGAPGDSGWLGRLGARLANDPGTLIALQVGGTAPSLALRNERAAAPVLQDERGLRLAGPGRLERHRARILTCQAGGPLSASLRSAAALTYRAATRIEAAFDKSDGGDYPGFALARSLRLIARLIAADFGTRVFHVSLGSFDTHARQAQGHSALLQELGGSLAAFQRDLQAGGHASRVTTLVHSEFGRRARENGSRGTDHGHAGPVLLSGGAVRGGMHGSPPDLEALVDGDVPFTTDFRAVYGAVERWLGVTPEYDVAPLEGLLA